MRQEPEAVIQVPDLIEPFIGWRLWRYDEERELLASLVYKATVWQPLLALEATCKRAMPTAIGAHYAQPRLEAHSVKFHPDIKPPHEDCACGVYAASTLKQLYAVAYATEVPILGRVALWGRAIECTRGWRAQFAYPVKLFVLAGHGTTASRRGAQAQVIESRYRVPTVGLDYDLADLVRSPDIAAKLA